MSESTVRGDVTRTGLVIEHLERLALSVNGNPRFRVSFTDGTAAQTMSDTALGYVIENREYRDAPLTVTFTAKGRIRRVVPQTREAIRAFRAVSSPSRENDQEN